MCPDDSQKNAQQHKPAAAPRAALVSSRSLPAGDAMVLSVPEAPHCDENKIDQHPDRHRAERVQADDEDNGEQTGEVQQQHVEAGQGTPGIEAMHPEDAAQKGQQQKETPVPGPERANDRVEQQAARQRQAAGIGQNQKRVEGHVEEPPGVEAKGHQGKHRIVARGGRLQGHDDGGDIEQQEKGVVGHDEWPIEPGEHAAPIYLGKHAGQSGQQQQREAELGHGWVLGAGISQDTGMPPACPFSGSPAASGPDRSAAFTVFRAGLRDSGRADAGPAGRGDACRRSRR